MVCVREIDPLVRKICELHDKISKLENLSPSKEVDSSSRSSPNRLAFVGSGPLLLTSIILATYHLKSAIFHNYDIDRSANSVAEKLVSLNPDLSERMVFHTKDIMGTNSDELRQYEVVFLAALVGMESDEKVRVIEHLSVNMADGAILVVRSAKGARAFPYPVMGPDCLRGYEVLSVYHATDDVINSVVVARKCREFSGENINQGFDILSAR
ncbi:hypothetical protein MIMGU_mgv11b021513mg [Erythranthe guttata]|uniref:Nicotianamine synthase n=1 Tax=Erythranthe guttata TaxID=4155 RepID=A0A022RLA2_ERYGU|nr:hypothetical protein MIMGU_mgv11b021513mg [Erythranthe guttata]